MSFITVSKFSREVRSRRTIRHLSDQQLLPAQPCPFCGCADRQHVTWLQRDPDVASLKCTRCHALSASRMPTPETLDQFYAQYYSHLDKGVTQDAPERLARHIFRLCRAQAGKPHLTILDFGGGDGTLSHLLAQHFLRSGAQQVEVLVIDTHLQPPVASGKAVSMQVAGNLDAAAGRSFDVVIASNVLDHIPAAGSALRQLLERMEPGGQCYARATYFEGLVRLAQRFGLSLDLIYPEHVHDLGQFFWNGLFDNVYPDLRGRYRVAHSRPSKVETLFGINPPRTLLAYILKFPHRLFGSRYTLVGGWEVLIQRQ